MDLLVFMYARTFKIFTSTRLQIFEILENFNRISYSIKSTVDKVDLTDDVIREISKRILSRINKDELI